jgi:putative oxidoreductase
MGADAPVPGILQALAALSGFGGGIALVIGLLTQLAALGIACTMLYAIFLVHLAQGDPFVSQGGSSYELAAVYLAIMAVLLLRGAGAYSLDAWLCRTRGGAS